FLKIKHNNYPYKQGEIKEEDKKLTSLEENIIKLLAQVDGDWLNLVDISTRLNTPKLLVERALGNLLRTDYIIDSHSGVHGTSYRLSSMGRDTAIDWGFIG
ncbi:MAG: hypothetical protein P8Z70_11065, partial [Desulfuromonadales bacterium]